MPLSKPQYGVGGWGPVVDALIDWYNANENGVILGDASVTDAKIASGVSSDKLIDGLSNKVFTASERAKLAGVAVGATSNSSDVQLRDRASHTGSQPSSSINDFAEAVQDVVGAMLVAGSNVTVSYDDAVGTLTLASTGGGSQQAPLDAEAVRDTVAAALVGGTNITVTVNDAADTITFSTNATQNSTDAALRDRSTHTGTQSISSVFGLQSALDSKLAVAGILQTPPVVIPYATTISPDASAGSLFRCVATGDLTLVDPTGGSDGQLITVEILASGADRSLTVAGVTFTLSSGKWWTATLRYDVGRSQWRVDDRSGGSSSVDTASLATALDPRYGVAIHAVGNSGASLTLDAAASAGFVKTVTLTANCTITLTGASAGKVATLELVLKQDATGGRTVAWPSSVKWGASGVPTLSVAANAVDRVVLVSYDGGASWLGALAGKGY